MNRGAMSFVKGVAAGMAVGAAVSMIGNPFENRKRTVLKKNAGKALKAIGGLMNNAQYLMK